MCPGLDINHLANGMDIIQQLNVIDWILSNFPSEEKERKGRLQLKYYVQIIDGKIILHYILFIVKIDRVI